MGKLLSPKMMPFLLGLLVGLVPLWFYQQQQRRSLATWKNRLSQAQKSYCELDQTHRQITQQYQKIQQQLQELERENQQLHQQLINLQQENAVLIQQQKEPTQTYQQTEQQLQQQLEKLQQENQTLISFCNYFEKCAISTEERYISLQEQYDWLQQEYVRLQSQFFNNRPPTPASHNRNAITLYSDETDFYQDETYELMLRLIAEELNRLPNNSYKRRRDLLKSLLECNPSQGHSHQIRTQIENLFSDYTGMTRRLGGRLRELGFSLTEGNHYKITWRDDQRYTFSFAKTPSDHRAGNNIVRDLIHLLF